MKILYPIFLKLSAKAKDDPFWRYILEDLAYGSCPYGVYFQAGFLCCFLKHKEFSKKVSDELTYEVVYDLLRNKAGILSEKNRYDAREKLLHDEKPKLLTKKMHREALIENFILEKGKEANISFAKLRNFNKYLMNLFFFKILTLEDLQLNENNQIEEIEGIKFEHKKIIIKKKEFINITVKPSHAFPLESDGKRKIYHISCLWYDYIESLSQL